MALATFGTTKRFWGVISGASILVMAMMGTASGTFARPQTQTSPVVRLAELQIDPAQVEQYKAALREEIDASVRLEPGVLSLYAVSVKGQPAQVRIFEVYADVSAYESHLRTPHFLKYKTRTQGMVQSLVVVETDPILLARKPQ